MSGQVSHLSGINIKLDFVGGEEVTVDGCIANVHCQQMTTVSVRKDAVRMRKLFRSTIEGIHMRPATGNLDQDAPISYVCFIDVCIPKRAIAFPQVWRFNHWLLSKGLKSSSGARRF